MTDQLSSDESPGPRHGRHGDDPTGGAPAATDDATALTVDVVAHEAPLVPSTGPKAAGPTLGRVRTAAEIAAEPVAIGAAPEDGPGDTPLAVAAGMALRARGLDRSSPLPPP